MHAVEAIIPCNGGDAFRYLIDSFDKIQCINEIYKDRPGTSIRSVPVDDSIIPDKVDVDNENFDIAVEISEGVYEVYLDYEWIELLNSGHDAEKLLIIDYGTVNWKNDLSFMGKIK